MSDDIEPRVDARPVYSIKVSEFPQKTSTNQSTAPVVELCIEAGSFRYFGTEREAYRTVERFFLKPPTAMRLAREVSEIAEPLLAPWNDWAKTLPKC